MATDATGSPTPLGIPKFNTSADAPSGLGSNAQMDSIDTLIAARVAKPSGLVSGEAAIWNGTSWDRSSVTKLTASNIANGIAPSQLSPGSNGQALITTGGAAAWGSAGAYTLISDQVLGAPATTVDISSIPATYKHLQLFIKARCDKSASATASAYLRINNDSGANYDFEYTSFIATAVAAASAAASTAGVYLGDMPAATATANKFASTKIDIIDYANTTEHKTVITVTTNIYNTTAGNYQTWTVTSLWRSTAAINRLTLIENTGSNLIANTRMTLYGLG